MLSTRAMYRLTLACVIPTDYCMRSEDDELIHLGLAKICANAPQFLEVTPRGIELVRMWQNTPLPVERWVDPRRDGGSV